MRRLMLVALLLGLGACATEPEPTVYRVGFTWVVIHPGHATCEVLYYEPDMDTPAEALVACQP